MSSTFRSLCRAQDIGANCYSLDLDPVRVVIDSGMHPKLEGRESLARFELIEGDAIDAFFLSHAHLDHTGGVPVFQRHHPDTPVYMTEQTAALAEGLLHNSVNVMGKKRDELGITEYPLFGHKEVEGIAANWEYRGLRKAFPIGPNGEVNATFYDAGHILGSVGIRLDCPDGSLLYTGDVNFEGQTLMRPADFPRGHIDTLVLETTRGDSTRRSGYSREDEKRRLGLAIEEAFERGGAALIPVFAIGKTQELLVMLHELKDDGYLRQCPVMIGGLSTKMTTIYDELAGHSRRHYADLNILDDLGVTVSSRRSGKEIAGVNPRCIYALSSGMMTEKTVSNGFAREFLPNAKNSLIFVGYADPESPAGKIMTTPRGELVTLDEALPPVSLNCDVHRFDFSGHATREQLLDYAIELSPSRIFLVHGEKRALDWFQRELAQALPGTTVIAPEPGVDYPLFG